MKKHKHNTLAPKTLIAIGYNDVYKDKEAPLSIADTLRDIPTIVILNYVLTQHWPLHYVMNAIQPHRKVIGELYNSLPSYGRDNLNKLRKNCDCILIDNLSTLHVCYEALRNYLSMDQYEDNDISPTGEELQSIFKAYLKANSYWTNKQKPYSDPIDLMLSIEVPFVEFKHPKPILSSAYKALRFFEFCETHAPFDNYLAHILSDLGLKDWHQYIELLVSIFPNIIKSPYVKFEGKDVWAYNFFSQFAVDFEDFAKQKEWDGNVSIKYLRDNFVVKISSTILLFLSPDLLVDKLYQALKFVMWKSIQKHKLLTPAGKEFKDLSQFLGLLGDEFSEKYLANDILTKIFGNKADALYTDEDVKGAGISSPSDFYILEGDNLAVIEYKDLTIPDNVKHSGDLTKIKDTILDRICLDSEKIDSKGKVKRTQKGVGQILDSISRLMRNEYNKLNPNLKNVKKIFPIVIATDITVSALGVNLLIIKSTHDLIKKYSDEFKNQDIFIYVPIIIDLNNLIDCAYMFNNQKGAFFKTLEKYVKDNVGNLQSFDVYVKDKLLINKFSTETELKFLLSKDTQ